MRKDSYGVLLMTAWPHRLLIPLLACAALLTACDSGETQRENAAGTGRTARSPATRPNILFIVWDTVRADRLSLYGHDRATTPYLDEFARQARIFENCISAGSTTVPAHASMFTGLLPTEHGASNEQPLLADGFVTLAELLRANGYRCYLYSENPHICARNRFTQGFDLAEHPWSPAYQAEALRITRRKLAGTLPDSQLQQRLKRGRINNWSIKAAGELAQRGIESWLASQDPDQPCFIFVNYMEAHRPLIPPRTYRERMMTPVQLAASYQLDYGWVALWSYVFGLREKTAGELEVIAALYDAALLELDDLLHNLLDALRVQGRLDDTVIVLVGDHGEHLGEHHLLDHQFSVYEPLMKVPLIVHYPPRFAPGRERRPVTNLDLFPTLLKLAGIDAPIESKAVSLLAPAPDRPRLGECPAAMVGALQQVRRVFPHFDPTPWDRTLRAYYDEPYKFIEASDGRHELYHLGQDPGERQNLIDTQPVDEAHRQRLEALGYLESEGDNENEPGGDDDPAREKDQP